MILVDTSVWIEHLRYGSVGLETVLDEGNAACHPFIIGELACGNLKNRTEILTQLKNLPVAAVANDDEALKFIECHRHSAIRNP